MLQVCSDSVHSDFGSL